MFSIPEIIKVTEGKFIGKKICSCPAHISLDTRQIKEDEIFLAIKGKNFDGHDFVKEAVKKKAKAVILEKLPPEIIPIPIILVKDTIRALSQLAAYQRKKFSPILVAITGSNGKTTTKEMLAFLLSTKYKVLKNEGTQNNQIGLPLTLLKLEESHKVVVLELGTNHFGEIDYLSKIASPNIGVILNIGPAHLEAFKNIKGVYKEKSTLIRNLIYPCIGVLNNDDPLLRADLNKKRKEFLVGFGLKGKTDFQAKVLKIKDDYIEFLLHQHKLSLHTLGVSNIYNALAALAVCRLLGLDYRLLSSKMKKFLFPVQRLQIKKIKSTTFIDDTYNSNPVSLKEALDALKRIKNKGRKIAVLGDMWELGEKSYQMHQEAGKQFLEICDIIIGVGKYFSTLKETLKNNHNKVELFSCVDALQAKDILFKYIKPTKNDIILVKGSRIMRMEEVIK